MKAVTIVGIRDSGKTTVAEALIREMTARGLTVGSVKSVFCPAFHMDKPGSNTDRHMKAGAVLVTARAETETAVIYRRRLKPSEIFTPYVACDWVICEGDYELPTPRIVAAHRAEDARERVNSLTLAVSGRIADAQTSLDGLPVLHYARDIRALADLLIERVPDVQDLQALDESLHGEDLAISRAYCETGCKGHAKPARKSAVRVTLDGKPRELTPEQEAELLRWILGNK